MTQTPRDDERPESTGPTVRDRRRIDPDTYQVREPQATAAPAPVAEPADDVADPSAPEPAQAPAEATGSAKQAEPTREDQLTTALAERTADLQRLQAEYVNYKRRVDRDRDVSRTAGVEGVLRDLLPALDTVTSARDHGELNGAFKGVAEELEKVAVRNGLVSYGQQGDPFDPTIHEALMHLQAPAGEDLTGPTCVQILQPGYRIGDRIVRPARVAVAEPAEPVPAAPQENPGAAEPASSTSSTEPVDEQA